VLLFGACRRGSAVWILELPVPRKATLAVYQFKTATALTLEFTEFTDTEQSFEMYVINMTYDDPRPLGNVPG
jgi:hypothetical protein